MNAHVTDQGFCGSSKRPAHAFAWRLGLLFITLIFVAWDPGQAFAETKGESAFKAAYLYNFAKFVRWPAPATPTEEKAIQLCTLGHDPFAAILASAVAGHKIRGRNLEVRDLGQTVPTGCDLLFINASEKEQLDKIFEELPARGVLTVGDFGGFLEAGGGIELSIVEQKRVRFRINLVPVNRAGLSVDSRLLALASEVLPDLETQK